MSRENINIPPEIKYLTRENVVMHISTRAIAKRSTLRYAFGHPQGIEPTAEESQTKTNRLPLKTFSIADKNSPFSHMRVSTPDDGKVRLFVSHSLDMV